MSDDARRTQLELAIERAFRGDPISRRVFLRRAGRGGLAAMSLPALIAACQPSASPSPGAATIEWANWPAYIDIDEETGGYPTLNLFQEQTGWSVHMVEAINDNEEFLGTVLSDLQAGNYTGWDVITPSDFMIEKLLRLGYLQEIDKSKLPNWEPNVADYAKGLYFDPDNKYTVWWQGGLTGIGYNPTLTGREITEFDDLLDPEFEGRVGLFSEFRDTFGLTLLSMGIEPANATVDDVTAAQQKLLGPAERGQFRGFYGNEYYDELAAGNLALCIAWSGDITQMAFYDNPDVKFVVPASGAMRWNDNLCIPTGTTNIDGAHALMNFWYDPVPATMLSEYIGYFTPVASVPERILDDAKAARDEGDDETADLLEAIAPTTEPSPDQVENAHFYKRLDEEEEGIWTDLYLELAGG